MGQSLEIACDDNFLVFLAEINKQAGCMDGYAPVVCLDLDGDRGQSLSKQQMVCWGLYGSTLKWIEYTNQSVRMSTLFSCNGEQS